MFNIESEAYQMNYDKRIAELANQPRKPPSRALSLFMASAIMSASVRY